MLNALRRLLGVWAMVAGQGPLIQFVLRATGLAPTARLVPGKAKESWDFGRR